jgi:hypothetical protein
MALELSIHQRLDLVLPALKDESFLNNRKHGGEINFHIFDYDPEYELLIRDFIKKIKLQLMKPEINLPALEVNLFELLIDILKERQFLDKAFQQEEQKGKDSLFKALKTIFRPAKISELIAQRIDDHRMVFLTGLGAAWPLIRSHSVLNNLHVTLDKIPLVVFFPGSYDGHELRLFSTLHDDNYYRAFQLVPRQSLMERTQA